MAYVGNDLAGLGFNPIKAIGRALGSTGRALVSAIPGVGPAASAVLEAGARMPAKNQTPAAPPAPQAPVAPSVNTAAPTTSAALVQGSRDALLDAVTAMLARQAAPPQQPMPSPIVVQSPATPAAAPSQMPPWAIPAAIGGVGLIAMLALSRR